MRKVYLDHSATTPVHPEVADLMMQYLTSTWGNPSSIHAFGREARKGVEEARERVAGLIGAKPEEIFFTSGGTEADNMAVLGTAYAKQKKGNHIIASSFEHHAVLDPCKFLEKQGYRVTFLPVTPEGLVRVEDVEAAITDQTILITIMHVNNEVGTIQPIEEIGRLAKTRGITFHTDAVQSAGKIPVDVNALQVDLMTVSAHKIYGPKGIGCLYVRKGTRLEPITHGGGQERKRRPGTENVPGMVGFGKAAELAARELDSESARLTVLRDKLIDGLMNRVDHVRLNGHRTKRIPTNVNVSIEFVEGESILLSMDMHGIGASSGSACTSGSLDPSHVLLAMGIPYEVAHGSLRMTLGRDNTEEDVKYVLEVLPGIIERLRAMSPLAQQKTAPVGKECCTSV
ncbi:cysteine desulfurase [Clostridiales bacterium PH28_bin88]|nr:cysteine desulfurase [Clostridiales bacterium PH28_bin88]